MKKLSSDREMLASCLLAMQSSKKNGGVTDWSAFIETLDNHLRLRASWTKTDADRYQKMNNFMDELSKMFLDGEGEWEELEVLGYDSFEMILNKIENLLQLKDLMSETMRKLENINGL